MHTFKVRIEGVAPLRVNRFTGDALTGGKRKMSTDDYKEAAFNRAYYDADKFFCVPGACVKAAIRDGGSKVSHGRGKAKSDLTAIAFVREKMIRITVNGKHIKRDDKKPGYFVHEDSVKVPPRTGARVMQYWVAFDTGWSLEFHVDLMDPAFPADSLKEAIVQAGIYKGLCDGRPEWGRFTVEEFERMK